MRYPAFEEEADGERDRDEWEQTEDEHRRREVRELWYGLKRLLDVARVREQTRCLAHLSQHPRENSEDERCHQVRFSPRDLLHVDDGVHNPDDDGPQEGAQVAWMGLILPRYDHAR